MQAGTRRTRRMMNAGRKADEEVRRALRVAARRLPDLFAPGARLVVGFSGGQDSTCLLHALSRPRLKLDVVAAHVDHALRPDSAETVLLNLLRGAGLAGLAGMPLDETIEPRRLGPPLTEISADFQTHPLRLARPLLRVTRPATLAYCAEFGLPVIEDLSNLSRSYTRNRVRLDLLPA